MKGTWSLFFCLLVKLDHVVTLCTGAWADAQIEFRTIRYSEAKEEADGSKVARVLRG